MTLPHSDSEVLRDHVVLENESIDRMYAPGSPPESHTDPIYPKMASTYSIRRRMDIA